MQRGPTCNALIVRCESACISQASQTDIWQNLEKYVAEQSEATGSFGSRWGL